MEPKVCMVADSQHLDEDPDPGPHLSENWMRIRNHYVRYNWIFPGLTFRIPVPEEVLTELEQRLVNVVVDGEAAGVHDAHVQPGLDGVVQEHAVHGLPEHSVAVYLALTARSSRGGWDLAKCGWDLAKCGWDLAESDRDLAKCGWDPKKSEWDLAKVDEI